MIKDTGDGSDTSEIGSKERQVVYGLQYQNIRENVESA